MDVTPELQKAVQAVLDDTSVPLLSRWQRVADKLVEGGLAWRAKLQASSMLVHNHNRGGLGVSGHGCHLKGEALAKSGFDMKFLHSAVCFEISHEPSRLAEQLEFNRKLVEQASGLLAPLQGAERYLSVSCGHTTQFVKAVLCSCQTPVLSLADQTGRLNREALGRDSHLNEMLSEGWTWLVISSRAESAFPQLPSLAEKAMNSSNSAFTATMEVESMLHMQEIMQKQIAEGKEIDVEAVASEVVPVGTTLMQYSPFLCRWLEKFSDGGKFLTQFLSPFSREHGGNCNLGEDFWAMAAGRGTFAGNAAMPMVRLAMLATNYAAPGHKMVDGYAKLIVQADWTKMKSAKFQPKVNEMEQQLYECWRVAEKELPSLDSVRTFGKCCIRMALHVLQKEKMGREAKTYKSLAEIRALFDDQMAGVAAALSPLQQKKNAGASVASLSENYDPLYQAMQQIKLELGMHYIMEDRMWKLVAMSSATLSLELCDLFEAESRDIPTVKAVKLLKATKQSAPELLPATICKNRDVQHLFAMEAMQAAAWVYLLKQAEKYEKLWNYICLDGTGKKAYTSVKIPKGGLMLVPSTDSPHKLVQKEPDKKKPYGFFKFGGTDFYILPPAIYRKGDGLAKPDTGSTCAYWWVQRGQTAGSQDPCCMEEHEWQVGKNNMIVVLQNSVPMEKHTLLTMELEEEEEQNSRPAKKAKK
ncbi:unnamed protein product [Symbiodinium sp. CCMP2592]|nr:unnamed protein product [Symbiodinium sp. CCMP2592]